MQENFRPAIAVFALRHRFIIDRLAVAHRIHQPEIDLTSPTTAVGTWAMDDIVIMTDWNLTIRGAAFYEDRYVKVDGEWKITTLVLTRLRRDVEV